MPAVTALSCAAGTLRAMSDFTAEASPRPDPSPPAATAAPPPPLLNRERSMLEFNRRVLAQARRADVPLLERLRYITIVSSNLDEFFEIRVAGLVPPEHREPSAEMLSLAAAAHELVDEQYRVFNEEVMPALQREGIVVLNHAERSPEQAQWVARFFEQQVRPLLVPVSLDPSHPFPQVANKSLNFIARLGGRDAFGRENSIAIVKVPRVLPRVMKLPAALTPGHQGFVLLTSVVRAHLGQLFPGRTVEWFSQFRVTRDSDLDVDEDEVTNLRQALRSGLTTRHFGRAIRLEVVSSCPEDLSRFLLQQFQLPQSALYKVNGPVNLGRLAQLVERADAPALRFPPFEPAWPRAALPEGASILERLQQRDILLHHPFESFEPVVQLLREAVADPDVLAIRQTIYRTGSESVLMDLLIEAARRGKEVMAVVELKARFDEEANINWAERLEAVGAQVVYGIVGLKTHAKLLLVTRREGAELRRYVHMSTGNYNPRTARLYTDLAMLSADPALGADADAVFQQLASQARLRSPQRLVAAPFSLHRRLLAHIAQVAESARRGGPARIVVKVNALTDPALIEALCAASRAGASIDLVVRGACMLAPGVPGRSERIRVRSVIGRFLEHTRVFYFRWGESAPKAGPRPARPTRGSSSPAEPDLPGDDGEVLYLSSADWMSRNMFGRIELAWPVRDPALRQRVIDEALVPYLHDEVDAWVLDAAGGYRRVAERGVSAQQALMQRYSGS